MVLILCVHHLEGCFIHWENILGNVIAEKSVFVGAMISRIGRKRIYSNGLSFD